MREHRGAIGADLRRFYGLDLADVGTLGFSWGHLRDLVESLPPSSATVAVQAGGVPWGPTEYLLRALIAAMSGRVILDPQEQAAADAERAAVAAKLAELEATERARQERG